MQQETLSTTASLVSRLSQGTGDHAVSAEPMRCPTLEKEGACSFSDNCKSGATMLDIEDTLKYSTIRKNHSGYQGARYEPRTNKN